MREGERHRGGTTGAKARSRAAGWTHGDAKSSGQAEVVLGVEDV